jgi:hypothetical protein
MRAANFGRIVREVNCPYLLISGNLFSDLLGSNHVVWPND